MGSSAKQLAFGGLAKESTAKKIAPAMGVAAHKDVRNKVAPAVGAAPQMASAMEQQSNFEHELRKRQRSISRQPAGGFNPKLG